MIDTTYARKCAGELYRDSEPCDYTRVDPDGTTHLVKEETASMKCYFRCDAQLGKTMDDGDLTLFIRVPNVPSVNHAMRIMDSIYFATNAACEPEPSPVEESQVTA